LLLRLGGLLFGDLGRVDLGALGQFVGVVLGRRDLLGFKLQVVQLLGQALIDGVLLGFGVGVDAGDQRGLSLRLGVKRGVQGVQGGLVELGGLV
jgi:hypothetical protein